MTHAQLLVVCLLWLTGCTFQTNTPLTEFTPQATATPSPSPPPSPVPLPWTDESVTMGGICFEAALARANTQIVIDSAAEHIAFYDGVDASEQCRRPVTRQPFDFGEGERLLAGLWNSGRGCDARHEVIGFIPDDDTLRISLRFMTEGDCNYDLVQPFWVGVAGFSDVVFDVTEGQ